jgi:ABC-type transporter Mla subunit MlaD
VERHRWPGLAALVALVVVFAVTVWLSYSRGGESRHDPPISVTTSWGESWRLPNLVGGRAGT